MPFNITGYTVPTNGAASPYFVIDNLEMGASPLTLTVNVNGYTSSTDYANGLAPITSQTFSITGALFTNFLDALTTSDLPIGTSQGAVIAELIGALQVSMLTWPFFAGATIVS